MIQCLREGSVAGSWCWRCKADMPVLEEAELASVWGLYGEGMSATKEFRQRWGVPLEADRREWMRPVCLTGVPVVG